MQGVKKSGLARVLSAGLVAVVLAWPVAARADALADAMAGAYVHSGLLEQNRALLRAADEDVAIAVSRLRPIVNWSASLTRSFARTYSRQMMPPGSVDVSATEAQIGLVAELVLFDGNRNRMNVDVAKETVLATRQTLIAVEQNVLFSAVQAFMEVRSAAEIVGLRRNNVRVIREELRAARDRFEVGEVTRTDVALTQARLAGAESALAQAEGDLTIAREFYLAVVGRPARDLRNPPPLRRPATSVEAAKQVALASHPELARARHQVTAADLGILIARAATTPQVRLRGNYGLTDTLNEPDYRRGGSVSLDIGGPVYQGGQLRALERKASAQRDAARGGLHATSQQIQQNVGSAFARLQVAQAALAATDQQISAARQAFAGVREEASLGARTTLDVLNAEQELLDAQANRVAAAANEYVAHFALLAAMGQLTVDALDLDVPRYDPAAYYRLVQNAPAAGSAQGRQLDQVLRRLGKE